MSKGAESRNPTFINSADKEGNIKSIQDKKIIYLIFPIKRGKVSYMSLDWGSKVT